MMKNLTYLIKLSLFSVVVLTSINLYAQEETEKTSPEATETKDTLTKMQRYSAIGEQLFKVIPVPIASYTTETGTVVGLAKYNLIRLVPDDTISDASSFSELVSASSEGQFKVVIGNNIYLSNNKINLKGGVRFIEFPSYYLGVGNVVSRDDVESITTKSIEFDNGALFSVNEKNSLYIGILQHYRNYKSIQNDTNSFLVKTEYAGAEGGVSSGFGVALIYDLRDHRYTPTTGFYISTNLLAFGKTFASKYQYNAFELDIRKFFNPWGKHVIALQAYTQGNLGTVPFYSLGMIGGQNRMRGYYRGAIRDKVVADAQVEYRLPIWGILGMTAFASAGRVAPDYESLSLDGLWYGGGAGLRIMVDKTNKANLRLDFGYGQQQAKTFSIGFTEAF